VAKVKLEVELMSSRQLYAALRKRLLYLEPGVADVDYRTKRQFWREAYEIAKELEMRGVQLGFELHQPANK
jgi:hypothetical protein